MMMLLNDGGFSANKLYDTFGDNAIGIMKQV